MQRFFDILFAGLALLLLLPLLLPIAVALRLTGEGEIFFRQERIGRGGKSFGLFKFATMLKNSPNMGTGTVTVKADPRILPMGHFLRKTKINELPQLLNILLGDMSVIGPRPLTRQTFGAYPEALQAEIIRVKPGLSGIGSIIFRGEEDILAGEQGALTFYNEVIAPYKGEVERWYVARQDIITYFTLIALTAWVVLFPRSPLVWRFRDLPAPPPALQGPLNYPGRMSSTARS